MKLIALLMIAFVIQSCAKKDDSVAPPPPSNESAGELGQKSLPTQSAEAELLSCEAQKKISDQQGKSDQRCDTILASYDFISGKVAGAEGALNERQISFGRSTTERDVDVISVGGQMGNRSGKIQDLGKGSCSQWYAKNQKEKIDQVQTAYYSLFKQNNSAETPIHEGHCYIFVVHDTRRFYMVGMLNVKSTTFRESVTLNELDVVHFIKER